MEWVKDTSEEIGPRAVNLFYAYLFVLAYILG